MSAEMLKRAAEKLRESALAATPGPWENDDGEVYQHGPGGPWVGETLHVDDERTTRGNAEYIRTLHPPVALALAALFEGAIGAIEMVERSGGLVSAGDLYAVARAVLREQEQ